MKGERTKPLRIIPSIESARAMWNLREIASWSSEFDPLEGGALSALLVRWYGYTREIRMSLME